MTRPDLDVQTVAEAFANYWHSEESLRPAKRDWFRCWQQWVRRERSSAPRARASMRAQVLHADDNLAEM